MHRLLTTMPANKLLKTVVKLVTIVVKAVNELASPTYSDIVWFRKAGEMLSSFSRRRRGFIAVDETVGVTGSAPFPFMYRCKICGDEGAAKI
ncbi:MAG: hypothetical protein QW797_10190 [Thermoproteota archaeon]